MVRNWLLGIENKFVEKLTESTGIQQNQIQDTGGSPEKAAKAKPGMFQTVHLLRAGLLFPLSSSPHSFI